VALIAVGNAQWMSAAGVWPVVTGLVFTNTVLSELIYVEVSINYLFSNQAVMTILIMEVNLSNLTGYATVTTHGVWVSTLEVHARELPSSRAPGTQLLVSMILRVLVMVLLSSARVILVVLMHAHAVSMQCAETALPDIIFPPANAMLAPRIATNARVVLNANSVLMVIMLTLMGVAQYALLTALAVRVRQFVTHVLLAIGLIVLIIVKPALWLTAKIAMEEEARLQEHNAEDAIVDILLTVSLTLAIFFLIVSIELLLILLLVVLSSRIAGLDVISIRVELNALHAMQPLLAAMIVSWRLVEFTVTHAIAEKAL